MSTSKALNGFVPMRMAGSGYNTTGMTKYDIATVSYTHLRDHETPEHLG